MNFSHCSKVHKVYKARLKILSSTGADPGFSVGGGANPPGGTNIWFFQNFPKTAWNWENFGPYFEGAHAEGAPLDPSLVNFRMSYFLRPTCKTSYGRCLGTRGQFWWPWIIFDKLSALISNDSITNFQCSKAYLNVIRVGHTIPFWKWTWFCSVC